MSRFAPTKPTIFELQQSFSLTSEAERAIAKQRNVVSQALLGKLSALIAIAGPCAMTLDRAIIDEEGNKLKHLQHGSALITLHRIPPWKPRTNPQDWHGLESERKTTTAAFQTIVERAVRTANVAIEIGHTSHIERYGHALSFAWIGGRNVHNDELVEAVGLKLPSLPIGIKNGLDGEVTNAIRQVNRLAALRTPNDAPVVLVYRGGSNAKTPREWEDHYLRANEATNGLLIVDSAHGSGMAHDPSGNFLKSSNGQLRCLNHIVKIATQKSVYPRGIMLEASDAPSPTDPVIPFDLALNGIRRLSSAIMSKAE